MHPATAKPAASAPAVGHLVQDKARTLRRWTWVLAAVAFVLAMATSEALDAGPLVISDAVSYAMTAGTVLGIIAYFVVRGEIAYRRARAWWIGAWVVVLSMAPAMFVAQRLDVARDAEKVETVIKALAHRLRTADQDLAQRVKAELKETTRAVLSFDTIADAAARKDARTNLAAVIRIVDDGLAERKRIEQEAIAKIEATGSQSRAKQRFVEEIRRDRENRQPLSVQMVTGMRAFLVKADELIAHVDSNEGRFDIRGGQIAFTEVAARDRHNALQSELVSIQSNLERLQQTAPKPR